MCSEGNMFPEISLALTRHCVAAFVAGLSLPGAYGAYGDQITSLAS